MSAIRSLFSSFSIVHLKQSCNFPCIAVSLPDHYIITGNFIEMCTNDYFNLTSQLLEFISNEKRAKSHGIWDEIAKILSFVCSCISIVCLIICITTYSLFDTLRTTPGKINLCLCVSLLIAQILQQFTIDLIEYKIACTVFGVLIHFSWAATLCWMSVSSFNLFRCFSPSIIKSDLYQSAQQAHDVKVHDVIMTSDRRRCDVMTSHRRLYDVIMKSCVRWDLLSLCLHCLSLRIWQSILYKMVH